MFFCLLYLISALSISVIAAYFSVLGLATIFPGSITSVIIMGGVLEVGKIVTAIWLHRNWKTAPFLIKGYLSFATLTLMAITSMGIFGFLSKAHIEHQTTTEKAIASAQVIQNKIDREKDFVSRQQEYITDLQARSAEKNSNSRLDIDSENEKIKDITEQMNKDISFEKERIAEQNQKLASLNSELRELESSSGGLFSNKKKKIEELKIAQETPRGLISKNISQYNANIDQFRIEASSKIKSIEEKITFFRNQNDEKDTSIQPQIDNHTLKISEAYGRIDELETQKIGFSDSARALEAEVGPVKYVAEAIADFTGKEFDISQAVRIVIIILVLVFDPLAILLVIAANISIEKYFPNSTKAKTTKINVEQLNIEQAKLESEIKSLNQEIEEKNIESQKISATIQSGQESLKSKEEELKLSLTEFESKNESLSKESQMINQNIKEKQIQLDKINNELDLKSQEIDKLLLSNQDKKIQLEKDAAELLIKEQSIQVAKTVNQDEENKLAEKIKNKEEILSHLESEKQKYSEEKTSLDNQNSVLKQSIETQKKLLSELQKTYKSAVKSNDLKGVFDHYSIDETTKILEDGQQIVTIKDKKGRVHQFILSKELSRSDRSYLHEIAKELSNVIDEDDCAEEYKILKKKYYRNAFPEYNFLT